MTPVDTKYPVVTVYMPTKNRYSLLKKAVASVYSQNYPNIELIICNDGSTDKTAEFLESLIPQGPVTSVKTLFNSSSKGACNARNQAIKIAKGHFVTGLDDDDQFLPNRVSSLVEQYDPSYAFICSAMIWDYGHKQRIIDKVPGIYSLSAQLSYNEATTQVLVEKERVLSIGAFDETFVACQDYDLWTRLIQKYGPLKRIAEPSYIINNTDTTQRMTSNPKSVKGYEQFYAKHNHLMSWSNKQNQEFMKLRRQRKRYPLLIFFKHLFSGHFTAKAKYFISSHLKI